VLGNIALLFDDVESDGLPFFLVNNWLYIDPSYSGEINFEIKKIMPVPVDEKFIPDTIARVDNVPRTYIIHLDSSIPTHEEDIMTLHSKIVAGESIALMLSYGAEKQMFTNYSIRYTGNYPYISFTSAYVYEEDSEYLIFATTVTLYEGGSWSRISATK
jgi:hypothetical protein